MCNYRTNKVVVKNVVVAWGPDIIKQYKIIVIFTTIMAFVLIMAAFNTILDKFPEIQIFIPHHTAKSCFIDQILSYIILKKQLCIRNQCFSFTTGEFRHKLGWIIWTIWYGLHFHASSTSFSWGNGRFSGIGTVSIMIESYISLSD